MLYQLVLPTGQTYTFTYNVYGEIDKVQLPTGGYERFEYVQFPGLSSMSYPYAEANRGVSKRHVSATGDPADEKTWTYSGAGKLVRMTAPDGSFVERYMHTDSPTSNSFGYSPNGALAGLAFDERYYTAPDASGPGRMLRRKLTKWETTGSNATGLFQTAQQNANRNPRVSKEVEILLDTGGDALAKVTTYGYDLTHEFTTGAYQTSVNEYGYVPVSQATAQDQNTSADTFTAPGTWLRRTEHDYLDATNSTYRLRNLLGLRKETRIKDASGTVVARTVVGYDGYSLDNCPQIIQHDAAYDMNFTTRGNVTSVTSYAEAAGMTGAVATTTHYDIAGNAVSRTDANGNTTTVSYEDSFSDLNNSRHTYAYPKSVTTAAPNPDPVPRPGTVGQYFDPGTFGSTNGFTAYTEYDYKTGLVTASVDANGHRTTYDYTDPLNRLKMVTLPDGGTTTYDYGRESNDGRLRDYVKTATALDSARAVVSYQFFDGLGRPDRAFLFEGGSPERFLTTDTKYDDLGRVWKVSNPHRTSGWSQPVSPTEQWTESVYDALGRVTKVTTPDGASVTTSYNGTQVTVTDQSGRKRRSVTDTLGRLVRVDEPDATSGSLDDAGGNPLQPTSYTYDVLGNLRKVEQGGQLRFFMYDSLGRLTRAKNPEQAVNASLGVNDPVTNNSQWSLAYDYDAAGNLTMRTDARGVQTSYLYDYLNRNIVISYVNDPSGTLTTLRRYDFGVEGKGRPYLTQQSGNITSATYFDEYDAVGRPLVMRQKFETSGVWSLDYRVARTYDLAGNVRTQTYPSGHTVTYNYDAAGRVGDSGTQFAQLAFTGNLGDGVARAYASGVIYSELGGLQQERFGTQVPLYHKLHYNRRGQLYDIRLSTQSMQASEWSWNRGAIVNYYSGNYAWEGNPSTPAGTDNNGNLRMQQTSIPKDDGVSDTSLFEQKYEYDALNRLKSVSEQKRECETCQRVHTFTQAYDYDRWGNRTINGAATQVFGQNPGYVIPEPQFELSPQTNQEVAEPSNRLYAPGDAGRAPAQKLMRYDAAGNLVHDPWTGAGGRAYDGENRMTAAVGSDGNWDYYTYDADGQRVRRKVGNEEWWQVYGLGGELVAEYRAGAASYLAAKEYGYRGGELLVTMASGDDQRLRRFVENLYYGALRRAPGAVELQVKANELAAAGVQGQAQLLQRAKEVARSLFTQSLYETSPARTERQYVTDLYYTYLQRAPDDAGLAHWTAAAAAGGVTNRSYVCDAFQESPEFATLVSTLYGTALSDDERTETFINRFYLGATGAPATPAQLQQRRAELNAAAAQGAEAVKAAAEAMGRELFAAQVNDLTLPTEQFVVNLYEGFLQRGPDDEGLASWTAAAGTSVQGRRQVLNAFAACEPFKELAGTLYRETYWLVGDQLGTPRMVVGRTGSLAGVKRHDYLPFGEELYAGMGGRTATQGYGVVDNVRQQFTGYEHDQETNLDYAQARYYASPQGRFVSVDPLYFQFMMAVEPQRFNLYAYTRNNPLKFVDPNGESLYLRGTD